MSKPSIPDASGLEGDFGGRVDLQDAPLAARVGIALVLVLAATVVGFTLQARVLAPDVALLYVLPVVVTASLCGFGASLVAVGLGVLAFDFFFTEPRYSFAMTDPPEIWAAVLLLIIATIVASVAAGARRRASEAGEAAERATVLRALAHAVVHARSPGDVTSAAAATLHRLFQAPSVVFVQRRDGFDAAAAGGASPTDKDREAAGGALATGHHTRGENYPYERTYFDLWPVTTVAGGYVIGVDFAHAARERPAVTAELVEAVAGYLAAAAARGRGVELSVVEPAKP